VTRVPLGIQAVLEWKGSVWKRHTTGDSSVMTLMNVMMAGMEAVPKIPSAITLRYDVLSVSQIRYRLCFYQPSHILTGG
jgi:hypothetical protein